MTAIRNILLLIGLIVIPAYIGIKCESGKDPYEVGSHWDYSIQCENGFVYKSMPHKGTIHVLNSDGTPLKCGHRVY